MPTAGAVFVDLDRTLIRSASGPVFHQAMEAEGVLSAGQPSARGRPHVRRSTTGSARSVPFIGLARAAAAVMRDRSAEATRRAGKRAVEALVDLVQPWALEVLAGHRREGRPLVLATTSPIDLVTPLADALGFDDVIATRYAEQDGRYTGRLDGRVRLGHGQAGRGGRGGRPTTGVDLGCIHAYSDSVFDLPLLPRRRPPPPARTPTPG